MSIKQAKNENNHDNFAELPSHILKDKYDELLKLSIHCIKIFNSLCMKVAELLLSEFPKNMELTIYEAIVKKVIEKNYEEPISLFLVHVFQNKEYREAIMNGDENFFKSNRHENLTSSDEDRIKAMFQFKSCWNEMNDVSKNYIKEAFKKMIKVCNTYLDSKCDYNKIGKYLSK